MLGCLIEKQRTTPDQYPLSLNSLRLACNQSTNRDPVPSSTSRRCATRCAAARAPAGRGSRPGRARARRSTASCSTSRSTWTAPSRRCSRCSSCAGRRRSTSCKTRTERAHAFADNDEVSATLARLETRELVHELPRRPGQREERWTHLFAESPTEEPAATRARRSSRRRSNAASSSSRSAWTSSSAGSTSAACWTERFAGLTAGAYARIHGPARNRPSRGDPGDLGGARRRRDDRQGDRPAGRGSPGGRAARGAAGVLRLALPQLGVDGRCVRRPRRVRRALRAHVGGERRGAGAAHRPAGRGLRAHGHPLRRRRQRAGVGLVVHPLQLVRRARPVRRAARAPQADADQARAHVPRLRVGQRPAGRRDATSAASVG